MKALLMDSIPAIASLVDGEALPELKEARSVLCILQNCAFHIINYIRHTLYTPASPFKFKNFNLFGSSVGHYSTLPSEISHTTPDKEKLVNN